MRHDPFIVDYLNSDSFAITEASLDEAASFGRHKAGLYDGDEGFDSEEDHDA